MTSGGNNINDVAYWYDTTQEGSDGTIYKRPGKCQYGIPSHFEHCSHSVSILSSYHHTFTSCNPTTQC